jgi:hypothetical protein
LHIGLKSIPQDLYETDPDVTKVMMSFLQVNGFNLSEMTVFEPSCGNGAIVKELESVGAKVIARDLYTMADHHDYLECTDVPDHQIMITNPPFALKYEFAEKAFASTKPFVLLLPLTCISTKKWMSSFGQHKVFIQILSRCEFLHNGKSTNIGECMWLYGNFDMKQNAFDYVIVGHNGENNIVAQSLDCASVCSKLSSEGLPDIGDIYLDNSNISTVKNPFTM